VFCINEGQVIELSIDNLAGGGDGVGRWQGMAVFVPGTLPGERVRARIIQVKKAFARGKLEEVLNPALARIDPECKDFEGCGGCNLQHVNYENQLEYKRQSVYDALVRIGKVSGVTVHPVIGMEYPWHYRNKVHLQVGGEKGHLMLGFFTPGSHRFASRGGTCQLINSKLNEVTVLVEGLLNKYCIEPFKWKKRRGLLRNVMLRIAEATGEIMVVFSTSSEKWCEEEEIAKDLVNRYPGVVSVVRNINNGPRQVVLSSKNLVLFGRKYITDRLGELTFCLSVNSFYQVNSIQAARLYETVKEYAGLTGKELVVDAYCGTGTITLYMAYNAKRVIGLESVSAAVSDARENARINKINNVEYRTGSVEKLLPTLVRESLQPDVIVLDPPRSGCRKEVLEAIAVMQVTRVVYVSCNPATLARDLVVLQERGYQVVEVQPVDMFPWTGHVETIIMMTNCGLKDKK